MLVHQASCFELDPSGRTRSALASHCGASRCAYNWGLALVKHRLALREQVRAAALEELCPDEEVARLARTVELPWTLPSLRKEWNREKHVVAAWWAENSKEACSSGLGGPGRALDAWSKARKGERPGSSGFPRFKQRGARRSCRFTTGAIKVVDDRHVRLPRIGAIATKERRRSSAPSSRTAEPASSRPRSPRRPGGGSSPSVAR